MAIYLNDWSVDDPLAALCSDFEITPDDLAGKEILVASYTNEDYSGYAYVLLAGDDGKLYEVTGSHCSCYGLEDQWSPEETSTAALRYRLEHGGVSLRSEPGLETAVNAVLLWLEARSAVEEK